GALAARWARACPPPGSRPPALPTLGAEALPALPAAGPARARPALPAAGPTGPSRPRPPSDRLVAPEVLVVVVVPAGAAADLAVVLDELDALDPLDVLEPQLVLIAQPQGRPVAIAEWLVIHLVGEHGQLRIHLLDRLGVVVD